MEILSKLRIHSMLGLFLLGFFTCFAIILLSRHIHVPGVTEINALLTPSTSVTPTPEFANPSLLGLTPGKSALTLLASPLTNSQVEGRQATVQETVTMQWLSKRQNKSAEEEIVILETEDKSLTVLGRKPFKILVKYHKPDELDLVISHVRVEFNPTTADNAPEALEILSAQFGPPTTKDGRRAIWKDKNGLTLTLERDSLQLHVDHSRSSQLSPDKVAPSSTPWLK